MCLIIIRHIEVFITATPHYIFRPVFSFRRTYLGTIFTKDGSDTKNIHHKVTQARKIIGALNGVWLSKNITRNGKKMFYNSMVKSVLIYGAETWTLYEGDRRRINATEMDAFR